MAQKGSFLLAHYLDAFAAEMLVVTGKLQSGAAYVESCHMHFAATLVYDFEIKTRTEFVYAYVGFIFD